VCARDAELMALTSSGPMFRLEEIDPISIRNEKDVLLMLKDASLVIFLLIATIFQSSTIFQFENSFWSAEIACWI
jgi:hypothetical protein